jgi:glycosyl transferase family 25
VDLIEKVVYINLESRPDRRAKIEQELAYFGDKVIRLNAVKHTIGIIGCGASHIKALELAKENNWPNVLIVEDDMMWNDSSNRFEALLHLETLLCGEYDVILLGGVDVKCSGPNGRLLSAQTATAYIVNNRYYDVLLNNYREGLQQLVSTRNIPRYALDMYWKQLQPRDKWFIILPSLCIQRPDYSDIQDKMVDYRPLFA